MRNYERKDIIKNIRAVEISNDDGKTMTIKCNEIESFEYGIAGYVYHHGFLYEHKVQTFVINQFKNNKVKIRIAQKMEINCIEDILKEFNIKILEF